MNPRLQPPQVGPQAWFATTMSSTTQTPSALTWLVHSHLFITWLPTASCRGWESPHFFFSHLDVTSLVVYVHQLSVYLYFIHVLLMYRSSLKLICFLVVSDRDAATGPETLMNGAILDFQHAPWRGSSDGVIFYFHVLRRCCWYSVSPNVVL